MTVWHRWGVLLLIGLCGCTNGPTEGSEVAARKHFDAEFRKWIAGQDSEVGTLLSRALEPPLGYELRSVVPDQPDPLAKQSGSPLPESWRDWPAWKFNAVIEWESQAGTPVEKVTTYTLTWNTAEKRWYVRERF